MSRHSFRRFASVNGTEIEVTRLERWLGRLAAAFICLAAGGSKLR